MTDISKPAIDQISIPVSPGELLDKISILKLKSARIHDAVQLEYVNDELLLLTAVWQATDVNNSEHASAIGQLSDELQSINAQLWDIEDQLRALESEKNFGNQFVELARAVYLTNDRRAAVKKSINERLGSRLREEKSYTDYQTET